MIGAMVDRGFPTGDGGADFLISEHLLHRLRDEAGHAHPLEACGLLLGRADRIEGIRPTPNIHPTPATRFEIDPQALFDAHRAARAGGPQLIGYYHSHPMGGAVPSATDRTMASGDGRIWAIIAREMVAFWRDCPEGFEPLSYGLLDG